MNMKELTLNEYQLKAMTTCMPSSNNLSYMLLNLVGEVGEFSSKVAKSIRKSEITIGGEAAVGVIENHPVVNDDTAYHFMCEELKKEAGDILWQLSGLCSVMGWNLEDISQMNLDKLASRKQRNVIDGNGDNR
jgi:NTP pyrophosphatase (non-canonical NTP hydrolase)